MKWMDDPKIARQLARASWVVLVGAFVLLTRDRLGATWETAGLAALVAVSVVLNAPVVIGLAKTRSQSASPAWRAVALAFGLRVLALVAVIAVVTAR